ncbi:MAG: arylsulfatase, partial [Bacteroidales bacterium]
EERVIYFRSSRQQAIRKGPWKLIYSSLDMDDENYELFNLKSDPYEEENLMDQYPEIVRSLRAEMKKNMELDDYESLVD